MPWRRLANWTQRLADPLLIIDIAVAIAFAVYGVADALGGHDFPGPPPVTASLLAVSALALIWRRRRPLLSFTVSFGAQILIVLAFGHFDAGSSLLICLVATLSVAAYGEHRAYVVGVLILFDVALNVPGKLDEVLAGGFFTTMALGLPFAVGLTMRHREAHARVLEERTAELEREQELRAAAAAAEERRRIARELHDIIAHGLGVVVLQAGAATQVLDRDPQRARDALDLIRHIGQEAIGEMGTLVGLMRDDARPAREPQPSLADLDRLIATTRDAGLPVELSVDGQARPLPPAVELSAFRVIQEGLTNALKHAGPAHAQVCVRYRHEEIEVEVTDDGDGSKNGSGGRHGLAGMRERVAVFGGRFSAGPRPSGGWQLRAAFPLDR